MRMGKQPLLRKADSRVGYNSGWKLFGISVLFAVLSESLVPVSRRVIIIIHDTLSKDLVRRVEVQSFVRKRLARSPLLS